jgi:predicted negative regulator of RcsB-dependent stress response
VEDYLLDEREQWERVKAWLREQGPWALLSVLIVALGMGAWRYWQSRGEQRDLTAAARYEQVLNAFSRNDLAAGVLAADELIKAYPSTPYANQADLAAARVAVEIGKLDQAETRLERVLSTTRDPQLKLIARLRLARVQLAEKQPDAALKTLEVPDEGAFAARYDEVRGDALLAKGDRAGALKAYQSARRSASDTLDAGLLDLKINELAHS